MIRFPLLILCSVFITGCAGYRLGPTNGLAAGDKSIEVAPFTNETMEPRLSTPVTHALRKRLQQDGTYRLESDGEADILVKGRITQFRRGELSFQPNDVITVRDYYIELGAEIVAIDRSTGRTNLTQFVQGSTIIRVGADLANAERQAVPLLAADLARQATQLLVDGTW